MLNKLKVAIFFFLFSSNIQAVVITGNLTDWAVSTDFQVGDGANHVTLFWTSGGSHFGFFYGSDFASNGSGDSDVAFAQGVFDINQVTPAESYTYITGVTDKRNDSLRNSNAIGDFMVWKNASNTGGMDYYGVLRVDLITGTGTSATLDGTWWFQSDGGGDFMVVPVPAAIWLFASGLLGLVSIRPLMKWKRCVSEV